jgi:hypothetical protein
MVAATKARVTSTEACGGVDQYRIARASAKIGNKASASAAWNGLSVVRPDAGLNSDSGPA